MFNEKIASAGTRTQDPPYMYLLRAPLATLPLEARHQAKFNCDFFIERDTIQSSTLYISQLLHLLSRCYCDQLLYLILEN